ncbi:hypothetical protein [Sphingomonas aerophila]|uniref:Uncharacterized protein n=1 Tax=Sphingomonas aerophila TaxID=1344948 RepID=A0A7W9BGU9_9SPHN|nr:hypothetical protein [Sphingomonas aerophila]MBB5716979.1 hypothetical protein [Sphingomonas aerophila]
MADLAASYDSSTDEPRVFLTAVDEALLLLLAKRLARALLLEAEADMATEPAQPRLDSAQTDSHS